MKTKNENTVKRGATRPPGIVQFNVDVPENYRRQLKMVAAMTGTTLQKLSGKVLMDFAESQLRQRGIRPFNCEPFRAAAHFNNHCN